MELSGPEILVLQERKQKIQKNIVLAKIRKKSRIIHKIRELFGFNSVNRIIRCSVRHHPKNQLFEYNSDIIRESCDYTDQTADMH